MLKIVVATCTAFRTAVVVLLYCQTVNPEECTAGVCCDVTNKTFLADGTECA